MSAKLKIADPNFTKARLREGRQWIGIKNLEAPDELQPRAGIDKGWVAQLAAWFKEGSQFPPAKVFQLPDGRLMLAEGHHRRWALLDLGESDMLCEIVDGTMDQAIEHAAGSNKSNGVKPMSAADVTRAIEMLFAIEKWWNRSDRMIASRIGCSNTKVHARRNKYAEARGIETPQHAENEDGRVCRTSRRRPGDREICVWSDRHPGLIGACGGMMYRTKYKGIKYSASTEAALREKVTAVFAQEDERKRSFNNLRRMLTRYGFEPLSWHCHKIPGFQAYHGYGVVVVPCDFSEKESLAASVGNAKLLAISLGRSVLGRSAHPHATRTVILCWKSDGPPKAIELLEQSGIEFMTPDELIRSLGAGGMTPDEIQASLKARTK